MNLTDLFPTPTVLRKIVRKVGAAMSGKGYEVYLVPLQNVDQRDQETNQIQPNPGPKGSVRKELE